MNNLPKVVMQQRRGRASNPRLLDRKSDALPLSHRATPNVNVIIFYFNITVIEIPFNFISFFYYGRKTANIIYAQMYKHESRKPK